MAEGFYNLADWVKFFQIWSHCNLVFKHNMLMSLTVLFPVANLINILRS